MNKIILVLVCSLLISYCSKSDSKEKEKNEFLTGALLSSIAATQPLLPSSCTSTNSITVTTTEQTIPFGSNPGTATSFTEYYSWVIATVTVGQKITFTSTTSNVRALLPYNIRGGNYCDANTSTTYSTSGLNVSSGSVTTSLFFTAITAGTYSIYLSSTTLPTDVKVKIE